MAHDEELVMTRTLASGIPVSLVDITGHYFGGYYHVRMEVRADIPVRPDYFQDDAQYEDAVKRLGTELPYRRTLEKMAVHMDELSAVRSALIESFENTVIHYLQHRDFARRFVAVTYAKQLQKAGGRVW